MKLFSKIKPFFSKYRNVFIGSILLSVTVYFIVALVTKGRGFSFVFFKENQDIFMDFFNSVRDASLRTGAYTERHVIYPPMANLILWLISFITPDAYNATEFEARGSWRNYPINIVLIVILAVLSLAAFAAVIYGGLKAEKKYRLMITAAAVFSVPCLYMVERGNMMVLAFVGLAIYAITYNSKSRIVRELGIIALAFSFSIKLYPIIFAWIMIADKRYKEFFRCALYSLAFLVIPSFFFGGPQCLWWIVKNIVSFSGTRHNVPWFLSAYAKIPEFVVSAVFYGFFALAALSFLVAPFVHKERWKVWAIGCIAFISYPALSSTYGWSLFIIPLIYLCNSGMDIDWYKVKSRMGYLIPMLIPFQFLALPMTAIARLVSPGFSGTLPTTANAVMVYVCILILSGYATFDTAKETVKLIKTRKKK